MADREAGIPNTLDTRFNLGSMDKMFTAVAVLQLRESGLLDLDDTIADVLPTYPNPDTAAVVTVEHLLTHTSGLGDTFTDEFGLEPHAYRGNGDYLPLFAGDPLLFTPGEEFRYSNAGFAVLGLIVESVSGMPYADYVRANVFGPAGMEATGPIDIEEAELPDVAIGYTTLDINSQETGVLAPNTALMPGRGFAGGGGYSTAPDLRRFAEALFDGRLLEPASLELLITGRVEVRQDARYAFGFFDRIQAGHRVVGHGGGAPGVCSSLSIYPDTGYVVVVLSNSDAGCLAVLEFLRDRPLT
jgi:CubicO group peptidase (beta-lactamase class C family)